MTFAIPIQASSDNGSIAAEVSWRATTSLRSCARGIRGVLGEVKLLRSRKVPELLQFWVSSSLSETVMELVWW